MEDEETKLEKPFHVDRAKSGRAGCKKCKQKIGTGELRLGKLGFNPFASGTMKLWHHVPCMFEVFKKQRKTTKKIDSFTDIEGWEQITDADKETIKSYFSSEELKEIEVNTIKEKSESEAKVESSKESLADHKDNSFRAFRKICSELTQASSYLTKTSIVKDFFSKGSEGKGFKGDLHLWCRSLLPMAAKRVYNLQSKQLVKIFSDIFHTSQDQMLEDLEQGDVAETISKFFEESSRVEVSKKAVLTLGEVDSFLEYLSKLTREADQIDHFKSILVKCTANDLKIVIRLIKHDLRINAGPKHILEALDPKAYSAFQASRDLQAVVDNVLKCLDKSKGEQSLKVGISIMTPALPMLAEACSSVEMAFRKCPDGMYSEIKYDGERVQLHKQGDTFKYFSRSLKPVLSHKVRHFEKYIPKAFPHGKDLILDSEILMVDTETGNPLPFGTLGAHKKTEFQNACVCLFVFDCIFYNGESLIDKPIKERRRILNENMTEITHHVMFSEVQEIHEREDLENMMETVFRQGLEGLVLKPLLSRYEPGKRHWLKVKKDYLAGGSMADTADLVVLGAWFGTGKKGGIMSVFLMGCHDEKRRKWVTVTKVHGGHDDKTLEKLQKELQMDKISRDAARVPTWLQCAKTMVPDFVAKDPKNSPVWEITGAEFTCNQVHTADGISIRFPRVTRIRDDKNWETATSLSELKKIYDASKDTSGFTLKGKTEKSDDVKKDKKAESENKDSKKRKNGESSKESSKKPKRENDETTKSSSKDRERLKIKNDEDKKDSPKTQITAETDELVNYNEETEDDSDSNSRDIKKEEKNEDSYGEDTEDDDKNSKEIEQKSSKSPKDKSKSREELKVKKDKDKKDSPKTNESSDSENSKSKESHRKDKKDNSHREKSSHRKDENKKHNSDKDKGHGKDRGEFSKRKDEVELENEKTRKTKSERKDGKDKGESENKKKKSSEETPEKSKSGSDTEVEEDPIPNAAIKISMKNKLPDVFSGYVICLHKSVSDKDLLKRFVIAYDGKIYSDKYCNSLDNDRNKITHYVYPSRHVKEKLVISGQDGGKHVSVDWLWDSVKKVKCLPEHDFRIKTT